MPARAQRTVDEHRAEILAAIPAPEAVTVPLRDAGGYTLAAAARARVDGPAFDSSAMDGFAVHAADAALASREAPARLRVVADLPAGSGSDPALGPGEAARIMTGAAVPTDADAVVPLEHTIGGLDHTGEVEIVRRPALGANIRRAGEDVRAGAEILPAGVRLGTLQLAALASAGVTEVEVAARPRVAVISTGSELAPAGHALTRGHIPESNVPLLAGLAEQAGAIVVHTATVPDEVPALERALAAAGSARADVVITSGGVGPGAYEVVRIALDGPLSFVTVAMRPGRPQGFGRLPSGQLAFGLPGTPVGAAVSFEVFVRPALLALQGRAELQRPVLRLPAAVGWDARSGFRRYVPVAIDPSAAWAVRPAASDGHSSVVLATTDGFAVIPPDTVVRPGDLVDTILLGGLL
ncbi:molybdopterin molybdotransferase MoeA [Microbacterium rhizosphaerae]|uniref:Molybdopterin molybdenumtransferase n=1 Tax=Microbacterium rhizosphaerae TaxID=1678237 RepID=A0ABZ0SMU1_9MICO|nr:gephyrin-like molybdotransferase Glp [Microbacterium rhizosphaerae]WPR88997.1 molybdopterin molybdotransferase MoeA [Microbacterium rhizosphaerae]